jgi:hypothetical protein
MIERMLCRIGYRKYLFAHLLVLFSFAICLIGSSNALAANAPIQQALIISIPLSDGRPESAEVQLVYKLESELTKAIERSRAGEYDGNEILAKMFTMYAYGPSADKLFDVARPILAKYQLPAGSRAVKRYGDRGAREERIPLDSSKDNGK